MYVSISSFLSSDAIVRTSRAGACRWSMSSKSVLALDGHISIRHSVSAGLVQSLRTKPTNWLWSCIEVCSTSSQVELACNEGPRIARVISKSLPKYRVHCINKEASPTQPGWLQGRYAPHSLHVLTAMPCLSSSQGQILLSICGNWRSTLASTSHLIAGLLLHRLLKTYLLHSNVLLQCASHLLTSNLVAMRAPADRDLRAL